MSTQTDTQAVGPPLTSPLARLAANRWTALPVVLAGTFMVVLDFFIVNVALPSMQADLHAGNGAIQWVVAGYALASAVFLITGARLGDRLGRRAMFSAGLAMFTVSSAACGIAPTTTVLVAARLVQGLSAAVLMPNVLSILGVSYRGADRARALGAYGLVMGIAATGGQLIGGALVQADVLGLGWRGCFLINVPIGLAALVLAPRLVGESRSPQDSRLDLMGMTLVTAAVTAIVLPLVEGQQLGWPVWTWVTLTGAPVLIAGFVVQQRRLARRGGQPLLDPALFTGRAFNVGMAIQAAFWSGQASFFLVLALYLQLGRGLSAMHAGLVFTILALSYVVVSARAPRLAARHGRGVLSAGGLVLAAGHISLLVAVAAGGALPTLVPGLLLAGAGMGLIIVPLTTLVMSSMRPEHAGSASGAMSTMQNVGNAVGVAITGAIFFGTLHAGYARAFEISAGELAVVLVAVAGLSRLLPSASVAS
jgi:EmrB/QacA subfamily drug resistance transporter